MFSRKEEGRRRKEICFKASEARSKRQEICFEYKWFDNEYCI